MFNSMFKGKSKVDFEDVAYAEAVSVDEAEQKELLKKEMEEQEKETARALKEKERQEAMKLLDNERAREKQALEVKRAQAPYVIVSSDTAGNLADQVNAYIHNGYNVQGNMTFVIRDYENSSSYRNGVSGTYMQVVYKKPVAKVTLEKTNGLGAN
jgi:hypothetical protein